jgi:hypothetical protein
LIAPDHSAYRAYLDPEVATLVPASEIPARFDGGGPTGLLFAGACWWEPDTTAAVTAIRSAIDGRDAPRRSVRGRVLRDLTWARATERLIGLLQEVADDGFGGRPWLRRPWRRRSGSSTLGGAV